MNKLKIICMAVTFLFSAVFIGGTAWASSRHRSDGLTSRGTINYDHGKIVIDANDLFKTANRIDTVENRYKCEIADALAGIRTYMLQDGGVSHNGEADIDPQQIKFSNLAAAVLQSQSVAHLADTQASDGGGLIYYRFEKNNILEVTNNGTGMPVYIRAASEDNLSAQTAAWVDGGYLAGNGADNDYFYQKGYIEGYAAKVGARVEYRYDNTGRVESAKLIFP